MIAIIGGRIIWGIIIILGMTANAFLNTVSGIVIQFVFILALMVVLNKTGLVRFHKEQKMAVRAVGK